MASKGATIQCDGRDLVHAVVFAGEKPPSVAVEYANKSVERLDWTSPAAQLWRMVANPEAPPLCGDVTFVMTGGTDGTMLVSGVIRTRREPEIIVHSGSGRRFTLTTPPPARVAIAESLPAAPAGSLGHGPRADPTLAGPGVPFVTNHVEWDVNDFDGPDGTGTALVMNKLRRLAITPLLNRAVVAGGILGSVVRQADGTHRAMINIGQLDVHPLTSLEWVPAKPYKTPW